MHSGLQPFWERAELLKADILAKADALPEALRGVPPTPGEWSVLQVISHMAIAESVVGRFVSDAPESLPPAANALVVGMVCAALGAGIALPAPDSTAPHPDGESLETLAAEWGTAREKLRAVFQAANPNTLYGVHPILGTMTVQQTVEMFAAHTAYHYKRFPKPAR